MQRWERLKRRVAHALRALAGDGERPNAGGSWSTMRELVMLAWPIATAMLGETLLGLVDTKLVGGLGAAALGGVGLGTTLMFLNYSIVFGLMRGVKVRTAHAVGRGSPEDGLRYAASGLVLGAILGACVWLLARDVSPLLRFVGIDEALVPHARDFFAAVTYGAPATCMLAALINYRQAIGDSRTPMMIGIGGNVINGVLSYGLIYGHFGLPALGVRGGGYGTASTEWLEVATLIALFARDTKRVARASTLSLPNAAREVCVLGVPTGLQFGAELLAMTLMTAILGSIAVGESAAHQIAMATIRTSFLPGVAVSEAGCILIGRALGRGNLPEADRVNRAALVVASSFMALCGIVFAVFGSGIVALFTDDAVVAGIARRLLWIAALFQVLDAFNIVLRGALRGAKDVRVAAIIGIAVVWTCIPSCAYFLGKLAGWGAVGGWCGFLAETTLASSLLWWRWSRGAWRRAYPVIEADREQAPASVPSPTFG